MNILITEQQLSYLIDKVKDGSIGKCEIKLDYKGFGPQYNFVYLNGVSDSVVEREEIYSKIKEDQNCNIILNNVITGEEFNLTSNDIKLTKDNKKLYITKQVFTDKIFSRLTSIEKYESFIKSSNIKKAIKIAFKDNWVEETDTHVAGVIGVLPIKDSEMGWSIVNFFNTKKTVQDMLKLYLVRDTKLGNVIPNGKNDEESVVNWMSEIFRKIDSNDMKLLVGIQEKSIVKNYEIEKKDSLLIRDTLPEHRGQKVEISGYGTKKDIIQGIDVTIGETTYQIKPLAWVKYDGDTILVSIGYSNGVEYKNKPVNRQAFIKDKKLYVFNNNAKSIKNGVYEFNKSDLIYPAP